MRVRRRRRRKNERITVCMSTSSFDISAPLHPTFLYSLCHTFNEKEKPLCIKLYLINRHRKKIVRQEIKTKNVFKKKKRFCLLKENIYRHKYIPYVIREIHRYIS